MSTSPTKPFGDGSAPEGSGGDEGIRTLDGLMTHTPLAGERLQPLGHVSVGASSDVRQLLQVVLWLLSVTIFQTDLESLFWLE